MTIFRECESSYDEVAIIYLPVVWRQAFICLCHVLVCSIDVPVESGGVIVLWSIDHSTITPPLSIYIILDWRQLVAD